MNNKSGNNNQGNISFQELLTLIDALVFSTALKHLSDIEILILNGSWLGHKYPKIAQDSGYSVEYLKNDVGPKLWKLLSQALGEKVSKSNLKAVLGQYIYQLEQKRKQIDNTGDVDSQNAAQNPESSFQGESITENEIESPNIPVRSQILHNLPSGDGALTPPIKGIPSKIVGRKLEIERLLELLHFSHPVMRVSIEGLGGIGKTTLALDVAHRCLYLSQEASEEEKLSPELLYFDAIIFTSAKSQYFTECGIIPRLRREKDLRDIFRTIARTLKCDDVASTNFEDVYEPIYKRLANLRSLLIIDNIDTSEQQKEILSFLYELPATVKVIITSRQKTPFSIIKLQALSQTEALIFIQQQAKQKGISLDLETSVQLYQTTGGVPAAIVYAVSQLGAGYNLEYISPQSTNFKGDFSRFYFESCMQPWKGKPPHHLLMALALFTKPPRLEAVAYIASVTSTKSITDALAQLQQLSLIESQSEKYTMLPLTRTYALAQLVEYPELEVKFHRRWVEWYLYWAQKHGGKDWWEWQDYRYLESEWENLAQVMDWCIANNFYQQVCKLWRNLKCYTYSLGYRQNRLHYWDTPLDWLEWVIQAAKNQHDWFIAAEMLGDRAWKLTLMGQSGHLVLAEALYAQAWEFHRYQTIDWQIDLMIHIGVWNIQKKQFYIANNWLYQAQNLLENSQIEPVVAIRLNINILYYRGEIFYKTREYEKSQLLFEQVITQAQKISWQRAIFLARDFLADIAIAQGNLYKARDFLMSGLQVTQENKDYCSEAYLKRSLANLEQKQGNLQDAMEWAQEAFVEFDTLGMISEASEAQTLLQSITTN